MFLCTWWLRERDNSPFDGVDGDRDSLLRLPLCYTMADITFNLAATGRVANESLMVITSTLSEPSDLSVSLSLSSS